MTPTPGPYVWHPERSGYRVVIDRRTGKVFRLHSSNQTETMAVIINRLNSEGWR